MHLNHCLARRGAALALLPLIGAAAAGGSPPPFALVRGTVRTEDGRAAAATLYLHRVRNTLSAQRPTVQDAVLSANLPGGKFNSALALRPRLQPGAYEVDVVPGMPQPLKTVRLGLVLPAGRPVLLSVVLPPGVGVVERNLDLVARAGSRVGWIDGDLKDPNGHPVTTRRLPPTLKVKYHYRNLIIEDWLPVDAGGRFTTGGWFTTAGIALPPGTAVITAEAPGYRRVTLPHLVVRPGVRTTIHLVMQKNGGSVRPANHMRH